MQLRALLIIILTSGLLRTCMVSAIASSACLYMHGLTLKNALNFNHHYRFHTLDLHACAQTTAHYSHSSLAVHATVIAC